MIERLHHADERELGRAIVGHVTKAEKSRAARNAHNMAVVAREHARQVLLEHPIAREQVDPQHRDELVLFALHERLERLYARVVD